jgi:SAM-dependent methyltransferase
MSIKKRLLSGYQIAAALCIRILQDPRCLIMLPGELLSFYRAYKLFQANKTGSERIALRPILFQRNIDSKFDAHYVIQAWWASCRIKELAPVRHVDVSSNVGFVAQLAAMLPVEFYEFNPPKLTLPNLTIKKASLADLPFPDGSVSSLSCLHVLEHIGLGRYGDPIEPAGMENACRELERTVQPGGHLFISFPVGRERTEFNSQRVIDPVRALSFFPNLILAEFSMVSDQKQFIENADLSRARTQEYACGLYHMVKLNQP